MSDLKPVDPNAMENTPADSKSAVDQIRNQLALTSSSTRRRVLEKFALAALGSIPWVGGFLSAAAAVKTEERGIRKDNLQSQWLEEHTRKMDVLTSALEQLARRFDSLGEEINERLESKEYLALVRQAFRAWDRAETEEKRRYVGNLIGNAAGTRICSDDVVRLFVEWLDRYDELYFAVIREIYKTPGVTRYDIWMALYGKLVREDSAEADLFKFLVRELGTGGVIRQVRDTTEDGQFLKKRMPARRSPASSTLESAFEDSKQYVLTELGKQFVHYTMNEVVQRLGPVDDNQGPTAA